MKCKDCAHFSTAYGGTCLGWADLFETNAETDVFNCSRFELKTKEQKYIPRIIKEYSEYDKI